MKVLDFLKDNRIILDGGMGTMVESQGFSTREIERLSYQNPDLIKGIHKKYLDAGSNLILANTFGANSMRYTKEELEKIIFASVENAKNSIIESKKENCFVALDIGPLGRLLKPYGDLDFEEAVSIFAESVKLGVKNQVDLVFIETMTDLYETKAALLAVKENSDLPVFVSNAYSENGKLLTGASPLSVIAMLEGMRADAIGVNCSFGPNDLLPVIDEYLKYSSLPIIFKPNAGLPTIEKGKTVFSLTEEEFKSPVAKAVKNGVRIVGGCCGTTPKFIEEVVKEIKDLPVKQIEKKNYSVISSYGDAVLFGEGKPILIGERINPTGKKRLKQALLDNDMDYILGEGVSQKEKGVDALDVNVGMLGINECEMLEKVVKNLQAVLPLPLQIDTSSIPAMERALRVYNGKPMINSVNGKKESMESVFPLVKKYGGVVVALTLDESGIPEKAEDRVEIAKRIIKTAKEYGIDKKDIIFDTLAMTISASSSAGVETLKALNIISKELDCLTSLGVSNVSFGLPNRDIINGTFFVMALENGLSCAIMNPFSTEMMKAYYSYMALKGKDTSCEKYIDFAQSVTLSQTQVESVKSENLAEMNLKNAIVKGFSESAKKCTIELLEKIEPLKIVNEEIIPALNIVGEGYENKKVFLPQLLLSAECAKVAFEEIKKRMVKGDNKENGKKIVLATVKGDVHDIGKNIVKLLLENYGFKVLDLGKDVAPEIIVNEVVNSGAYLCGLSALMTTTVPSMEETIKLLREKAPLCKVVVGGAVLDENVARSIGADFYAKDGMDTVRYAEEILK